MNDNFRGRLENKLCVVACNSVFNEEKTIARVILQAQRYMDRAVVCDDSSGDPTSEIVEVLNCNSVKDVESYKNLKCLPS